MSAAQSISSYRAELNGAMAQWQSIEGCARRADVEERTWRVRCQELGLSRQFLVWTDARTVEGAKYSVLRGRQATCRSEVEIVTVEEES